MKSDFTQDKLVNKYFLSPKELADYFGVSLKTIYRRIEKREIPFYKIGGSIRLKKEDIEKYASLALVKSICK
jgi:excisionase family DNA binding protein